MQGLYSKNVTSVGSELKLWDWTLEFGFQLYYLFNGHTLTKLLTFFSLNFLLCQMGITVSI